MSTTRYLSGFGNEHAAEAIAGALPVGQNSPQRAPFGLYAEQLSGTPFTAPRAANRRSWLYRIRPSAVQPPLRRIANGRVRTTPFDEVEPSANRLRWDPFPIPEAPTDFVEGLATLGGAGDASMHSGYAIHIYTANRSMRGRCLFNADGELLLVPQLGAIRLITELGVLEVSPREIAVIPRGMRFRVELVESRARGYVCENYGAMLRLPDLGPIGSNGLANPRDFLAPVASFEDDDSPCELIAKVQGNLWATELARSPFDVVAWHGNYVPYKYDTAFFNTIHTVSFDHPDPSIYTVLTSPSEIAGTANVDFVIFPPRWMVAEHTFRPPWFHRNFMSEFMGLVYGQYDAKAEGFVAGGASLHNGMLAHGPDASTFERASAMDLVPRYVGDTMAFMFETRFHCRLTRFAAESAALQRDYDTCWDGLRKQFTRPPA